MLWTLQRYIFREMGKTFLLTALGLMVVLGLGGGVMNMIELHQVTAWQLLRLMGFVLPIALALTLPIAALYSAASAYGRLSADNEFVACRSGGINILVLFAPPLLISLFSAIVTFAFINFIIPGMIRDLNRLMRTDLERIVLQSLKEPGGIPLIGNRYRIFADQAGVVQAADEPGEEYLQLRGVAFLETDGDEWVRSGSAQSVALAFELQDNAPVITGDMYGLTVFDHRKNRSAELEEHQRIGPYLIPRRLPLKIKWLDLVDLSHYRRNPYEWEDVRKAMDRFRALACGMRFYEEAIHALTEKGKVRLGYGEHTCTIRADQFSQDQVDGRLTLMGKVVVRETTSGRQRRITGERAVVKVLPGRTSQELTVEVEVFENVQMSLADMPEETIKKDRLLLDPFPLEPQLVAEMEEQSDAELLADGQRFPSGSPVAKKRAEVLEERGALVREILGVIHSRMAFTASVFVLVLLAAALGIIFRGSHVLTAFGTAFVPALVVIVSIVAGRQMIENPATVMWGVGVLWSGIALIGLLDVVILFKVLRR